MLGSTHQLIAEKIGSDLGLSERNIKLLVVGSMSPDSWADFPHHSGKDMEISRKLASARNMFLKDDDECYVELGIALHYLEDRWTLRPRLAEKHTDWENQIDISPLLDDLALLKSVDESAIPQKAIDQYKMLFDSLIKIRKEGIESVFDPEWGFWLDYDTCIGMLVGTLEQINLEMIKRNVLPHQCADKSFCRICNQKLLDFYNQEGHDSGMRKYVDANFVVPVVSGYQAAILWLAKWDRESTWSTPIIDINIAYRICMEISRYTLTAPKDLKVETEWNRPYYTENEQVKGVRLSLGDENVTFSPISGLRLIRLPMEQATALRRRQLLQARIDALKPENAFLFHLVPHSEIWDDILTKMLEHEKIRIRNDTQREKN